MDLMRTARHRIGIASHSLDAELFDHDAVISLLKRIGLSGRGARIQILVEDITPALQNSHRLVALAQRLSSVIEVRRGNRRDDPEFGPAVVLTDNGGWLRRPDPMRYEGEASLDDRPRNREMWLSFDRSWERAEPETSVRALKL